MTRLFWLTIALVACVNVDVPAELPCSLGAECPPGFVCDGFDLVCRPPGGSCGDGTRNAGERCDDGNFDAGDGCRTDCKGIEQCGDGLADPGEICDDNNLESDDGCDANCTTTGCGNAITTTGEVCDDGNTASGDGCRADCAKREICGDDTLDGGEVCEDQNVLYGDGCSGDCRGTEVCGDMHLDLDEQCDGQPSCASCRFTSCNDGNADVGELCPAPLNRFIAGVPELKGFVLAGANQVTADDVDDDGDLDVVWTGSSNEGGFRLFVQANDGTGRFAAPSETVTLIGGLIRMADFDGDGDRDVLGVVNDGGLAGHLNTDGAFATTMTLPTLTGTPDTLVVGDVDGDLDVDVVVGAGDVIRILRNAGNGTFTEVNPGFTGRVLALANFDANAAPDLITSECSSVDCAPGTTAVLRRNNGAGVFGNAEPTGLSGRIPTAVVAADIDDDDDLDLLASNCISNITTCPFDLVTVANAGSGTLDSESRIPLDTSAPATITVAKLDGDTDLDVLIGYIDPSELLVLTSLGNGSLAPPIGYALPGGSRSLAPGDFDGDGDIDVAAASERSGNGTLLINRGNGELDIARSVKVPIGSGVSRAAFMDADSDGDVDFAIMENVGANAALTIVFNDGGVFSRASASATFANLAVAALASVDLDADGDDDLVAFASGETGVTVVVLTSNGAAGFTRGASVLIETPGFGTAQRVGSSFADLDGDGHLDVLAAIPTARALAVLRGDGSGGLAAPSVSEYIPAIEQSVKIETGDVDGDGDVDVVTDSGAAGIGVAVFRNNGGTLALPQTYETFPQFPSGLVLVDLDADGDLDLVTSNAGAAPADLSILRNDGGGSFGAAVAADLACDASTSLIAADLDKDGDSDLVATCSNVVSVVRTENGLLGAPLRIGSTDAAANLTITDIDRDGAVDLLWFARPSQRPRLNILPMRP